MIEEIKKIIKGDVKVDQKTLDFYSHDTSLFEVIPKVVVYPKNRDDVKAIVNYVRNHKKDNPSLSITARSGGSCMSGGAINDSIIIDYEKYFKGMSDIRNDRVVSEPGVWYRDFEKETLKHNKLMPSYPASRELCAIGGMVANDAGGEKSLVYGKTDEYVKRLKVILADGNEYEVKPLDEAGLRVKLAQKDYEGDLYNKVFNLINKNYDLIKKAKPHVTKNSTGYNAWDVWDKDKKVFDLTKLFVGSQGTLGQITETEFSLVDNKPYSGMLVAYVRSLDNLGELIARVVEHRPTSFETFDDHTLKFAMKFFIQFRKTLGWWGLIKLAFGFIPDALMLLRGFPKLIMLVEYEADTEEEVAHKIEELQADLETTDFNMSLEKAETEAKSARFWLMRRESFALLRKNMKGNIHTAPFIDDLIVPPINLPQFLPEFKAILEKYELLYTIAGHMGDGNFHVIPLMDFSDKKETAKIEPCLREVTDLTLKYGGSISGEHNDGLIRGPFLEQMYGPKIMTIFKEIKNIFDPEDIFNPHKKVDANWDYSYRHFREHF